MLTWVFPRVVVYDQRLLVLPGWAGPGMSRGPCTGVQETWDLVQPESLLSPPAVGPWVSVLLGFKKQNERMKQIVV